MRIVMLYVLGVAGLVALGIKEIPALRRELKIMRM
jgi:hypothetical protein